MDRILETNATLQYQYCNNGDGAFNETVESCKDCLRHVPSSNVLINCTSPRLTLLMTWLTESASDLRVLQEACQQRPTIGGNTPVRLAFDLYNTTLPPSTTSTTPARTTVTSFANPLTSESNSYNNNLALGIGLGLGIPLCILTVVLVFRYRRRHRQRTIEREAQLRREWEAEHHDRMQGENKEGQTRLAEMMVPIEHIVAEKDGQQAPTVPRKELQSNPRGHPAEMEAKQRGSGIFRR